MHWKLIRALGIVGGLVAASAVVIGKIILAALEPEPYEKKDQSDGRHDSGGFSQQ